MPDLPEGGSPRSNPPLPLGNPRRSRGTKSLPGACAGPQPPIQATRTLGGRFRKRIAEYGKPFSKLSKLIARARDREDRFENGFRECTRFGDASPHELVLGLLVDPRLRERAPTRGHRYACRWPHSQFMRRKQRRWQRVEARLRWISRRFLGQRALNVRCIPFSEATPITMISCTRKQPVDNSCR